MVHFVRCCCAFFAAAWVFTVAGVSASEAASFSMAQVLSYPFPITLTASPDGRAIVYAVDRQGLRSIWVARAPQYIAREVVAARQDDGIDFNSVMLDRNATHVVYVRGGSSDPDASTRRPRQDVWSVGTSGGKPTLLGEGHAPAISADGTRVAFELRAEVWSAPIDGKARARRLFYDLGRDSDLQWSPKGDALAFVSSRGDHAFIGVYRGPDKEIEFLAPSVTHDMEPRWSPDGTRVAFARTPGDGGTVPSPLAPTLVPWAIWVARVSDGAAKAVWESPHTARASFPTQGGDVDLNWAAGNRIVFVSEMDNWPHLYSVSAAGGAATLLTRGAYAVGGVALSGDLRSVLYTANSGTMPADIDRSHLYSVDVATGKTFTLSSGSGSQWWPTPLADGSLAYVSATAQQPPLVMLERPSGQATRTLDQALLPRDFPTRQLVTPRDVTFHAPDGTLVHGQFFAQPGSARRPAIVFVHGGPMREMLLTWNPMDYYSNSYAVNQYLVSRGFAVLSVNYRSGVGYGHDFHYALKTGWTGASEYQDVLAGARWLQGNALVDPSRIGIWGGSWGGYLTALALARNSDVFKAGVDFSGVHDLVHDAVDYFGDSSSARLMDLKPWFTLAWDSSPDASISTWRSPVLVIQGDDDPDVSFHQLVDLVPRLQQYHVPYEQIVLADEVHGFLRYASWLRTDEATASFFERHFFQAK
ncbi:MAG TPA: prolyl oligopeptidase family serine peptidase [Candidatus Baltobacteraceae bacterium]